jgi:hypothetical protein
MRTASPPRSIASTKRSSSGWRGMGRCKRDQAPPSAAQDGELMDVELAKGFVTQRMGEIMREMEALPARLSRDKAERRSWCFGVAFGWNCPPIINVKF